ncbi:MAG: response regulator [Candidatus Anammoxibacter sp.]
MSKQILVIDDEEIIRESFVLALRDSGYSVETASTGEEGIEKVKEGIPDLIFLDMRMPGIGGIEALRRLRNINKDVPIFIITALYANYLQQLNGLKEEGIDFEICRKPLDSNEIRSVVESVLKKEVKST